ncbi:MAG TPA: hydroxyisourate hydrolase [Vicinamibacterales bacterium]|jgi:5-hydroxyisourate hydrolase
MSAITTHVLDTALGRPAAGIAVRLEQRARGGEWTAIGQGETDRDGRLRSLHPEGSPLAAGVYRITFDTKSYFASRRAAAFYPEVVVVFETTAGETHYHVPLLIAPFGFTTYRGT